MPTKEDFNTLKIRVVNITSSTCQSLWNTNGRAWEDWLSRVIDKSEIEAARQCIIKYANERLKNADGTDFMEYAGELVRHLLLDDRRRDGFKQEVQRQMQEQIDEARKLEEYQKRSQICLKDTEILFETQQDGHSLFAAVAQVLYKYDATLHHYNNEEVAAHVNEMRHAAAWFSIEYNRVFKEFDLHGMWEYHDNMLFYADSESQEVPEDSWGGSLAIQLLTNYIQRPIYVYERVKANELIVNRDCYRLLVEYFPVDKLCVRDTVYDPVLLVRSLPNERNAIKMLKADPVIIGIKVQDWKTTYHYDVIVPKEEIRGAAVNNKKVNKFGRPLQTLNFVKPSKELTEWATQRQRWVDGQNLRKILRLFQWFICHDETRKTHWFDTCFYARKWDNIIAQLTTQIVAINDTSFKSCTQASFWFSLANLADYALRDLSPQETYVLTMLVTTHGEELYAQIRSIFYSFMREDLPISEGTRQDPTINTFDFFKFSPAENDSEMMFAPMIVMQQSNSIQDSYEFDNTHPTPSEHVIPIVDVDIWAIELRQALDNAAENRSDIYQAFIDLFWQVANAKKVERDATIRDIASRCFGEDFTKIENWKTIIELANDIWNQILRLFCDVCEKVRRDWTGNYKWTQENDMYKVNTKSIQDDDREPEGYLYLPYFQIIFESVDAKPKKLFIDCTTTWYNRLRKQTMECWMQELLQRNPQVHHEQYDPFFNVMLSKEEIARYAEGSQNADTGRRYCLPANCFAQYANNVDISDEDPELRGFKERFFSKDKHISNLCKVIFRLRKICAFCRKAKEYERHDENGQVIQGGNTEKIQELRDSIRPGDEK
jgi:hypothetical protein